MNKSEIIKEIISLEPELESKKEEIEKLYDEFISLKPDFEISGEFKSELKKSLLETIKEKDTKKWFKFSYLNSIISFVIWWVASFSIIWILWVDTWVLNIWKDETHIEVESQEITPMMMKSRSVVPEPEMWIMMMDSVPEAMTISEGTGDTYVELRAYLEEIGLNNDQINKIIEIIQKIK